MKDLMEFFGEEDICNIPTIFNDMEIADIALKEAEKNNPESVDKLKASFVYMRRSEFLFGKSESVYRVHIEELINRVIDDSPLSYGTKAECLCVIMNASLKAPLINEWQFVAEKLFNELFPEQKINCPYGLNIGYEYYYGHYEEKLNEVRKKTKQNWRDEEFCERLKELS